MSFKHLTHTLAAIFHAWALVQTESYGDIVNQNLYKASMMAAKDTVGLAVTNTVLKGAGKLLQWSGEQISQWGWNKAGKALKWLGGHSDAAIFATNSYQHGLLETGTRMATGVIAEETVVQTGSAALRFFAKPKQANETSQPSLQNIQPHMKAQ